MKLVSCKTCGKEIAKGAICPGCGSNNKSLFSRFLGFYFKHPVRNTIVFLLVMSFLEVFGKQYFAMIFNLLF